MNVSNGLAKLISCLVVPTAMAIYLCKPGGIDTAAKVRGFGNYKAQVFYLPFGLNLYAEVDELTIVDRYDLTSSVSPKVDELVKLLNDDSSTSGSNYFSGLTRLKVKLESGDIYFVDIGGTVKYIDARNKRTTYHKLSRDHKTGIEKFLLQQLPPDIH